MVYLAKILISGRQKIALALLLAIFCVLLAYYPRVTEALLAFCLGGEVPGTNIVLSPTVVLAIVVGVFVFGILAFGLRIFFRARHNSRTFIRIPVTTVSKEVRLEVAGAITVEDPKFVKATGKNASLHRRQRAVLFMNIISHRSLELTQAAGRQIARAFVLARTIVMIGLRAAGIGLDTLLGLIWIGLHAASLLLWKAIIWSGRTISRRAKLSWKYAKPRLEAVDEWLEIQFRKLLAAARAAVSRHESI